jgi:toxin ParE1/3/4
MKKLRFTNKAVEDLTQIWDYTRNKWSENQADIYYSLLIDNCKEISSNPGIGNKYSGIREGLFGRNTGKHIIFYREVAENEIEIVRILHEQMDLMNRLKEK